MSTKRAGNPSFSIIRVVDGPSPGPFRNSLSALIQLAARRSGAEGYALFRRDPNSAWIRLDAGGAEITADLPHGGAHPTAVYPLGSDGILAFSFRDDSRLSEARPRLKPVVAAVAEVWAAAVNAARLAALAVETAEMQTRLMDSKIADRVRGLLAKPSRPDEFEKIPDHIQQVLRPAGWKAIEEVSRELADELEDRELANRAKDILQVLHGMSEEEAHLHLRRSSRSLRRKVRDVAMDLIRRHPSVRSELRHAS